MIDFNNSVPGGIPLYNRLILLILLGGTGWSIDRIKLETMLQHSAKQHGVDFYLGTKIGKIEELSNKWHLKQSSSECFNANFIVDAAGRPSWLAVRLGSKRYNIDHQIVLAAKFKNNNGYCDQDSHPVHYFNARGYGSIFSVVFIFC
jgi:flavin-dependent dehydrogenase